MSGAITTVTDAIVARLAQAGVTTIFGVPGGECNLDFIAAAETQGLRFVLTRTETSAVIMACVTGELTGTPGVAMTTRGPGLAAAANGVAYADLDRSALLLIADGYEDDQGAISHQRIDQSAVLAPMLRASSTLRGADPIAEVDRLIAAATGTPPGPAYLEVAGSFIRGTAADVAPRADPPALRIADPAAIDRARAMLRAARRPIVLAGLQARSDRASAALRSFMADSGVPVLTSYKAKGVVSEQDPRGIGLYAGGVAEERLLRAADLILLYGFDPVEGPPQPFRYADMPLLELTEHKFEFPLFAASHAVIGDIADALRRIGQALPRPDWSDAELRAAKAPIWSAARVAGGAGIAPSELVDTAIAVLPADTRITIDAGAHMLPVLHLIRCSSRNQSLISRGLSTMGFALPAAIAASLADPDRTTVAFTGDGGIMMCLGELGTAIEAGAAPIVVVFNDSALTLIGAKQRRRQMKAAGVAFGHTDFAKIAEGFGWASRAVTEASALPAAFAEAQASARPFLIDVAINPDSYDDVIVAIRG